RAQPDVRELRIDLGGHEHFLAIRGVDSGAEPTQPFGVRAAFPATPLAVEAVRSRTDRGVGYVPPVARVVSRAGAGRRVVRHLVVLEARRSESRVGEQKITFVARVGGLDELPASAPVPKRRVGLDCESVKRQM